MRLIQHEIRSINDNSETAAQEIRQLQSAMGELCLNTRVDALESEFGKISSANMEQITEARASAQEMVSQIEKCSQQIDGF